MTIESDDQTCLLNEATRRIETTNKSMLRTMRPPKLLLLLAFVFAFGLVSGSTLDAQQAEADVADNGTNPGSLGFKWMPYYRSTELDNGVKDVDALTLFTMVPLAFISPFTALVFEWPVLKYRDYSSILEGAAPVELGGSPSFPSGLPPGIDTQRLARGDLSGWGDFRIRLIQGLKQIESINTIIMAGGDVILPFASDLGLSSGKYQLAPMIATVTNFDPTSFLAILHFYFFDIGDSAHEGSDQMGEIGFYMARIFYQKAFPSSGYYLLPEVQFIYDSKVADGVSSTSLWFGPEVGKSWQSGTTATTAYLKPGFGISADPGERKWSVEMGMRFIPR